MPISNTAWILLLLLSVSLLEGGKEPGPPPDEARPRVARPVEEEAPRPASLETSQRCDPAAVPVAHPVPWSPEAVSPPGPARTTAAVIEPGGDA